MLQGIDDLIRAGFETYRATCFNWLLVATGLVVAGLICEGPELSHEITSIILRLRFTQRFQFSLPEEHTPDWAKLLAFIGWLLIVIGVAGEYVADSFVSKADGYVQTFDEILLTEAQRGTAFARERASAAYERASENEKETADTLKQAEEERADAAKSLEVTKGYESRIAQANERAANAELETARLRAQMADRDISPEQRDKMLTALKGLKPEHIVVQSLLSEGREALQYAGKIGDVFQSVGWDVTPPDGMGVHSTPVRGVFLVSATDEKAKRLADVVARVLIVGKLANAPVALESSDKSNRPVGDVEIWVGSK